MQEPQVHLPRPQQKPSRPRVSVIIPVFNDAERLKICLTALAQQTYPQALTEVIVVDNGSDDAAQVKDAVSQLAAMGAAGQLRAVWAQEPMPGSYAARNRGIALAQGEVFAFTDADCIPETDWIEQGVNHLLSTPNCGLAGGEIAMFFRNPQRLTPVELYEKITAFDQKRFIETRQFAATANLFTTRAVLERVGEFNTRLKSGGDIEWGQRVAALGYQQLYVGQARVAHPARSSFAELYRRTSRLAGGSYDLYRQGHWLPFQRNTMLIKGFIGDLLPPLRFVFNAFRDFRLRGFGEKLTVSLVMFFVRYVSACERIRLMLGGTSTRG